MRRNKIAVKFSDWKQNVRKNAEEIFCIATIIIFVVVAVYSGISCMNQIRIVENPTFTGEVVGKESRYLFPWVGVSTRQMHQLHIVGEYFNGEETIQIDRVFVVSHSWYNRFEVGDLIFH